MFSELYANNILVLSQLLVALVSAFRYSGAEIDGRLAKSEADALHDAIKDKHLNHEEVIRIVSTRSKTQFLATTNAYRDEHGASITKVAETVLLI